MQDDAGRVGDGPQFRPQLQCQPCRHQAGNGIGIGLVVGAGALPQPVAKIAQLAADKARSARVKSYPVVERYPWLWIWVGDAALADLSRVPDFHWFDDPNWGAKGQYLHVKANSAPMIRERGELVRLDRPPLSAAETRSLVRRTPRREGG